MALRVTHPVPIYRGGGIAGNSRSGSSAVFSMAAATPSPKTKPNPRKSDLAATPFTTAAPTPPSPFRFTEDFAARFGLEIAVPELERLFSSASFPSTAGGGGPFPPSSGAVDRRRRRPPVRVAYQGVRGSYCQEAAARAVSALGSSGIDAAFPCGAEMEGAFSTLEVGDADMAVVPVENSLDGPIHRNLDLLVRHAGSVRIVGEIVLPVNHCLLSLPGASAGDIRRVLSHPQAISHCRGGLESMGVSQVDEVHNAADAAKWLAEERVGATAVIGSEMAAKEFDLEVIRRNFQDQPGNFNRFFKLGVDPQSAGTPDSAASKTTLVFSLERGVTDLFQAMWAFETRGVAVNRVEHRPNRGNPLRVAKNGDGSDVKYFDYVFILDVQGSESDRAVRSAISRLGEIAGFVKVLGSYATCDL